ncbi:MAG: tyrosine-protein phosphatase [Thermodesulfovibrionia bacterium]|nr:tyrosine-protein phosphatase [Thermodesulfovibrionia bacterium]
MRNVYPVIRLAMLGVCLILTACATLTQPSAVIAIKDPHPAPVYNFHIVIPGGTDGVGAIYRSGQPKGDADWCYLEKIGIKTVVKLNKFSSDADESEELRLAKKHNINVIPLYMQPEDFPHNLNPWASPDENILKQAIEALEKGNNWPVLVHCSHGKDRTGLVIAAYTVRNKNFCKDTAYAQMRYYGTNPLLFGIKPRLYNSPNIKENPGCTHEWIAQ